MAELYELDPARLEAWLEGRPQAIHDLIAKVPPNRLFRLKETGDRGWPVVYSENGTITLAITGEFNRVVFDREVFGISPDDLEECDLPPPGEELGALLTEEEDIEAFALLVRKGIVSIRDFEVDNSRGIA